MRSQKRIRMSLTSSSRSAGVKERVTAKKFVGLDSAAGASSPLPRSNMNHWNSMVSRLSKRHSRRAYRTPRVQPKRVNEPAAAQRPEHHRHAPHHRLDADAHSMLTGLERGGDHGEGGRQRQRAPGE